MDIKQLQSIINNYFRETDNETLVQIVDTFVYDVPNPTTEVSKIIEKFIEDNGLETAFINYHYDKTDKATIFRRSSMSESGMIQDIKLSLLSLSFNRLSAATIYDTKIKAVETTIQKRELKIQKIKDTANIKSFNFMKNNLISCYASLNNNDQYFYSEKEDAKFIEDLRKFELL